MGPERLTRWKYSAIRGSMPHSIVADSRAISHSRRQQRMGNVKDPSARCASLAGSLAFSQRSAERRSMRS